MKITCWIGEGLGTVVAAPACPVPGVPNNTAPEARPATAAAIATPRRFTTRISDRRPEVGRFGRQVSLNRRAHAAVTRGVRGLVARVTMCYTIEPHREAQLRLITSVFQSLATELVVGQLVALAGCRPPASLSYQRIAVLCSAATVPGIGALRKMAMQYAEEVCCTITTEVPSDKAGVS